MINPAVRQRFALVDEIGRREAEEEYAALTAQAALARQALIAAHGHNRLAVAGCALGGLAFVLWLAQGLSPAAAIVSCAVGLACVVWLLTERIGRRRALAWAESRQRLVRLARRRLDHIDHHGVTDLRRVDGGRPR
jgi:hypothetical protein